MIRESLQSWLILETLPCIFQIHESHPAVIEFGQLVLDVASSGLITGRDQLVAYRFQVSLVGLGSRYLLLVLLEIMKKKKENWNMKSKTGEETPPMFIP